MRARQTKAFGDEGALAPFSLAVSRPAKSSDRRPEGGEYEASCREQLLKGSGRLQLCLEV